jgi:hypothetical protein
MKWPACCRDATKIGSTVGIRIGWVQAKTLIHHIKHQR